MKGGRWVTVLKAGTATRMPIPRKNMRLRSNSVVPRPWSSSVRPGLTTSRPRSR